jgi:hypothetical protein
MLSLTTIYIVALAASLALAVFASLFVTLAPTASFLQKLLIIPIVSYVVSIILSVVLQAITCKSVLFSSTLQGNLLFFILLPVMYLMYHNPMDSQTLPYVQRIVTSVLDSSWSNDQKSPFAYAYWTFFTSLVLFAFLLPIQTVCAN